MRLKVWKFIKLSLIGFGVPLLLDPLLHEFGHMIMGIAFGARVVELTLFPLASVLLDMSTVDAGAFATVLIGISGVGFPIIICFLVDLVKIRKFEVLYANICMKAYSVISFVMVINAVVQYVMGNPIPGDDFTLVLNVWKDGAVPCVVVAVCMIIGLTISVVSSHPIDRMEEYYFGTYEENLK